MIRRRKLFLFSLSTAVVAVIIGVLLLAQNAPQAPEPASPLTVHPADSSQETSTTEAPNQEAPSTEAQDQETPTDELPEIEIPDLNVVPEVPYGTIAIFLAMLLALLIVGRRSKKKALP